MTITNAIWYLIIACCVGGVALEANRSIAQRSFSTRSAGWMMAYIGSAVLAIQPLIFPTETAPAAARAYVNGGGAVLIIGLIITIASHFLRRTRATTDGHSMKQ